MDQLELGSVRPKMTVGAVKLLQIVTEYFLVDWFTMADQIRHRQGTVAIQPDEASPFVFKSGFRGAVRLTIGVQDLTSALSVFMRARPQVLNTEESYKKIDEANHAFAAMNDARRGSYFTDKEKNMIMRHYKVTFEEGKMDTSKLGGRTTVLQLIKYIQYGGQVPRKGLQPRMTLHAAKKQLLQLVRAREEKRVANLKK
jgi:DNA-binding transcriptional ArsR family regulator